MRPVVALTCYVEPASWGAWRDVPAVLVPAAYAQALRDAGAQPLLVPPEQGMSRRDAAALLGRVDALVLAGGADVDAARYASHVHPMSQRPRQDRDETELALVQEAGRLDLPVLGICRGLQLMVVAAGGTLHQHLPDVVGHHGHSPAVGAYGSHAVRLAEESWLGRVLGPQVEVSTHHHQGVASHPGHVATGWADDGLVEAVEAPAARLRVGVQWHPEVGGDPRLLEAFVAEVA